MNIPEVYISLHEVALGVTTLYTATKILVKIFA